MAARGSNSSPTFGFLTVVEDPEQGLLGGYLALNAAGRPLEFHCTAPVRANRAQEILYGGTLAAYLEGELIGGTLLRRAKTPPCVVCTDRAPVLDVRHEVDVPVILVLPPPQSEAAASDSPERAPAIPRPSARELGGSSGWPPSGLIPFRLGVNRVAVATSQEGDRRLVEEAFAAIAGLDLLEPFSRIREALQEARSPAAAPARPRQSAAA